MSVSARGRSLEKKSKCRRRLFVSVITIPNEIRSDAAVIAGLGLLQNRWLDAMFRRVEARARVMTRRLALGLGGSRRFFSRRLRCSVCWLGFVALWIVWRFCIFNGCWYVVFRFCHFVLYCFKIFYNIVFAMAA